MARPMTSLHARRAFTYATRRLLPGDQFEAPDRDARILMVTRRARRAGVPALTPAAAPVEPPPADPDGAVLKAAREAYEAVTGKRPYWGWDVETLNAKIAEAQNAANA